jgi:phosphatidylserine/phosphatidylglycerophosphate/cardiolipin synthase-like enzyme
MSLTLPAQTLRAVATDLRRLTYTPTSWQGLLSTHSEAIRCQLEPLLVEMVREGAHPRLMALLLDRLADAQDTLQKERNAWSFVWSGPDPLHAKTADTFATVDQLINEARCSLLIATYNIGLSSEFRELFASIADRLAHGQLNRVDLFFHPKQMEDRLGPDPLATIATWFNQEVWPWPAKPHAYVDRRLISGSAERCYQHARVVIADASTSDAKALVTSANFSETAQRHNFEAGWLTKSAPRAQEIQRQFALSVNEGLFLPIEIATQP